MIRIHRGPEPEFLSSKKIKAAKEMLQQSFQNNERQERARFDTSLLREIKPQLMDMCHKKCAYCESRIGVTDNGDIENFRPKAGARGLDNEYAPHHYWWLAYEWENLLMSCQICNQKYKRDYFPLKDETKRAPVHAMGAELLKEDALLIDPCLDNPEEHLRFFTDGKVIELTSRGKATIDILGLNRQELVQRRSEAAENLKTRLDVHRLDKDPQGFIKELESGANSQEYAAVSRVVFKEWMASNKPKQKTSKVPGTTTGIAPETFRKRTSISRKNVSEISQVTEKLSAIKRFSIKTIEIENFKSIDHLSLNILPVNTTENRESWLLLLGDNGIGKSSILQAISLALAGKKQLAKLKLDVTDFLKRGRDKGFVRIQSFEHDKPVEFHFDKKGFTTDLEEAPGFILAYGSTRLLPKGAIKPDKNKEPYLNIRNLFDYSVALGDPAVWLKQIDETEFKNRVAPAFFDVLALRGEDKLWIDKGKVKIRQFGENHDLDENSDGYKTIVALVTDIMQTLSIDSANYHNTQGIVLIDEIGNHLHPRWRMKIVGALRKAFPKLQFVVTTHEPLCLRGVSRGEVVVLVRDQQNKIRSLDRDILPDHNAMRIEQLLTSDLFGLINVMDEETEKTYEEYYALLSKKEEDKTPEDRNKIIVMSSQLAEKELLGATPQTQAVFRVVNETYAQKVRDEGFKTKEVLKLETVEEVKTMIKNKNLDWL